MNLSDAIQNLLCEQNRTAVTIHAPDAWNVDVTLSDHLRIRNLREGDVPAFYEFMAGLEPGARDLFAPYPWNAPAELGPAFQNAIRNGLKRVDAMYFLLRDDHAVGHFFLWKAGGNPHSQAHGVELPELGIALAQSCRGKGLGTLAVRILLAAGASLSADGVELTTAFDNSCGWETYRRCGFEYVGDIENPLDVDVAGTFTGEVEAKRWRLERQMMHVLKPEKRELIGRYLAFKREQAAAQKES